MYQREKFSLLTRTQETKSHQKKKKEETWAFFFFFFYSKLIVNNSTTTNTTLVPIKRLAEQTYVVERDEVD